MLLFFIDFYFGAMCALLVTPLVIVIYQFITWLITGSWIYITLLWMPLPLTLFLTGIGMGVVSIFIFNGAMDMVLEAVAENLRKTRRL